MVGEGDDSWFGSMATAIEVVDQFKVYSTLVIKKVPNAAAVCSLKAGFAVQLELKRHHIYSIHMWVT